MNAKNRAKRRFRIIIPAHDNADTLENAVQSVAMQSFGDFELIVVEDCSSDETAKVAKRLESTSTIDIFRQNSSPRFNGGTRNVGMCLGGGSDYTLFLDADDEWISPRFLESLDKFIKEHKEPDIVRLPYVRVEPDGREIDQTPNIMRLEHDLATTAKNCRVACWTKAVRTELLQPFPENTLMEDVCQHLKQCDVARTIAYYPEAVTKWHIRPNSTSNSYSPKWKSSAYRFVADLMDLELTKPYTKARRDEKLREALANLRRGIYEQ